MRGGAPGRLENEIHAFEGQSGGARATDRGRQGGASRSVDHPMGDSKPWNFERGLLPRLRRQIPGRARSIQGRYGFIRRLLCRRMTLTDVQTWVSIAASSALVVSVILLAYNVRASRLDARRNLAFSIMEQLTSADFAARRWKMHRSVEVASADGWKDFDNSLEDFESRSFAYQYELIGQMVSSGTLDYPLVRDSVQYTIVLDWNAFAPLDARLRERYPGRPSPWTRFRQLAQRITTDLRGPELLGGAASVDRDVGRSLVDDPGSR